LSSGLALNRCRNQVRFYYFLWVANRWLSIRYSLLSALVVGLTGFFVISAGSRVDAALAGFALTFALDIQGDVLFLVRRFTALELSLVAVERVKEYSEIELEAPGIVEPRPPAIWPHSGEVVVTGTCNGALAVTRGAHASAGQILPCDTLRTCQTSSTP